MEFNDGQLFLGTAETVSGIYIGVKAHGHLAYIELSWSEFVQTFNEMGNILKKAQVAHGTPPEVRQDENHQR